MGNFPDFPVTFLAHLTSDLNRPWACLSSKPSLTMTMVSWWLLVDVSSLFYIFGVGYAKESVWQYSSNFLPRLRIKVTHLRDETPLKQLSGHLSDVKCQMCWQRAYQWLKVVILHYKIKNHKMVGDTVTLTIGHLVSQARMSSNPSGPSLTTFNLINPGNWCYAF